jgi:hypothetical protein
VPRFGAIWAIGFANLVFTAVGLFAMATLLGLPLFLAAAALNVPQESVARTLAYTAILWGPLGAGLGLFTAGKLVRGVRRTPVTLPRSDADGAQGR